MKHTLSALSLFAGASAFAAIDLQVTEIWPGNAVGDNLTEDWFELTNFGDEAWTAAGFGDLYYDDDSADFGNASLMEGITSIAAGESVIYVVETSGSIAEWVDLWDDVVSVGQVGNTDGSGLSQNGDGVSIFLDGNMNGVDAGDLLSENVYPDANGSNGGSYDPFLGQFSFVGDSAGSVATTVTNLDGEAAIGTPFSAVPEPSTYALIAGLAMMGVAVARRRAKR